MKAYTDIEQSKRLAEILPLESADGFWEAQLNESGEWEDILFLGTQWASREVVIPCWSLAALLDAMPSGKALIHDKGNRGYKCICNNIDTYFYDNLVDACVEMIVKLHELKML